MEQKFATVLVVGSGGREHALAWKLSQDAEVGYVYVAPGNAGTASEPGIRNVAIDSNDNTALVGFAREQQIQLVVIGPEQPLAEGLADQLRQAGILCCGPGAEGAQLESSKIFCKSFLERHGIATAVAKSYSDFQQAVAGLQDFDYPLVIKADGLAAGKGVIIAEDEITAKQALEDILLKHQFGNTSVLIEQFLEGEEISFIVLTDGDTIEPFASSQDHKRRDEGDTGPNTGGMGAYSPAPRVDAVLHDKIMHDVIEPTVRGLARDGIDYKGFLYAGLMVDSQGTPWVLEYNCRLGDPETQPLMMRIDTGLYSALSASARGDLQSNTITWKQQTALCVVLAAQGYPEQYNTGENIVIDACDAVTIKIFHAGTQVNKEGIMSAGGRVLGVTGLGNDVASARNAALDGVQSVHWPGKYYRRDIGHRALSE